MPPTPSREHTPTAGPPPDDLVFVTRDGRARRHPRWAGRALGVLVACWLGSIVLGASGFATMPVFIPGHHGPLRVEARGAQGGVRHERVSLTRTGPRRFRSRRAAL